MSSAAILIIIVIIVIVGWSFDVRYRPNRQCPSCKGSKKNRGSTELRWGTCRRCGGKGEVRRWGAPSGD